MTEEQREKLNHLVNELRGTISNWSYSDPNFTKERIIIEYDVKSKRQNN